MCWKGFPWEKWSCFHKQFLFFSCIFISVSLSEKRCDIQCLGFTKLSQESCGLPEWFLSRIYFKNYMFFPEGKIKCGWELNKKEVIWTTRVILSDFMFCGIAAGAAFGSVLPWVGCVCSHCQCIYVFIYSRNGSGIQNPGVLKKNKKTKNSWN